MSKFFDQALDEVLNSIQDGGPLSDCLARYPQNARQLRLLAETASLAAEGLSWVEPPSSPAMARGRRRFLETAARPPDRGRLLPQRLVSRPRPARSLVLQPVPAILLALLLLVLLGSGMAVASAGSLPGTALYPVKRFIEGAQSLLTLDPAARERLQAEFAQERLEEAQEVLRTRRTVGVAFEGELTEFHDTLWVVAGLPLVVTDDTVIEGRPVAGRMVTVQALAAGDGRLLALHLRVFEPPATTVPAPLPPQPTATTQRTAQPQPTATPPPTALPQGTATPPPSSTHTPQSSATPPAPTSLPVTATPDPAPSHTPQATATATPHSTHTSPLPQGPTATPYPTATAVLPRTPTPRPPMSPYPPGTPTPHPSGTPQPPSTSTPDLTRTAQPSKTPHSGQRGGCP